LFQCKWCRLREHRRDGIGAEERDNHAVCAELGGQNLASIGAGRRMDGCSKDEDENHNHGDTSFAPSSTRSLAEFGAERSEEIKADGNTYKSAKKRILRPI